MKMFAPYITIFALTKAGNCCVTGLAGVESLSTPTSSHFARWSYTERHISGRGTERGYNTATCLFSKYKGKTLKILFGHSRAESATVLVFISMLMIIDLT